MVAAMYIRDTVRTTLLHGFEMALFDKLIMKATAVGCYCVISSIVNTVACKLSEISNTDRCTYQGIRVGRLSSHDFLSLLSSNINNNCLLQISISNVTSDIAWTAEFLKLPIGTQIRTLNADHTFCTEELLRLQHSSHNLQMSDL